MASPRFAARKRHRSPAGTCSILALAVALRDRQSTVEGRFAAGQRWETAGKPPPGSSDRPLPVRASGTAKAPGSDRWRLGQTQRQMAASPTSRARMARGCQKPAQRQVALDGLGVGVRTVRPPDGFAGQQQPVLAASTTARGTKGNSQQTPGSLPRAGLGPGTSAHRRLPLRQPTRPRPAS